MTTEETNPFASPETVSAREPVKLAAMAPTVTLDDRTWPYEATELATIEELSRPLGRPVSAARKWGNGRWVAMVLLVLTFGMVFIGLFQPAISMLYDEHPLIVMGIATSAAVLLFTFMITFPHDDPSDRRSLTKLIRNRNQAIEPSPTSEDPEFVVLVPRSRWDLSRSQMTAYVAFVHIFPEQKQIILDGDQFRFQIPVNSLLDISAEPLKKRPGTMWFVRLVLQTKTGPQELCFRLRNNGSLWQTDSQRKANAEEYKNRILLLKTTT